MQVAVNPKQSIEKGKSVRVNPVKEKLNQGSGEVVVTNDVKGNQLYAKEKKIYLDQRKKIEKREDENFKIDVNRNQIYTKESKMYLDQKKLDIREDKTSKKKEPIRRQMTEPGCSGCCGSSNSSDPCGSCDAECCDLFIMILCFPLMMFDDQCDPLTKTKYV